MSTGCSYGQAPAKCKARPRQMNLHAHVTANRQHNKTKTCKRRKHQHKSSKRCLQSSGLTPLLAPGMPSSQSASRLWPQAPLQPLLTQLRRLQPPMVQTEAPATATHAMARAPTVLRAAAATQMGTQNGQAAETCSDASAGGNEADVKAKCKTHSVELDWPAVNALCDSGVVPLDEVRCLLLIWAHYMMIRSEARRTLHAVLQTTPCRNAWQVLCSHFLAAYTNLLIPHDLAGSCDKSCTCLGVGC